MLNKISRLSLFVLGISSSLVYADDIPGIYSNVKFQDDKLVYIDPDSKDVYQLMNHPNIYKNSDFTNIVGTEKGFLFSFPKDLNGYLYFGFIDDGPTSGPYPQPIYYKVGYSIDNGKVELDMTNFAGNQDAVGWQKTGRGKFGYRVVKQNGEIIYDGKIGFVGKGPFKVATSIIEGPFVNKLTDQSVTLVFETNRSVEPKISLSSNQGSKDVTNKKGKHHEVTINGLKPNTKYSYSIVLPNYQEKYTFKTNPSEGERSQFTFAYASDSRAGAGSGERDISGANAYVMKRVISFAKYQNAQFMVFTGDLTAGYANDADIQTLEHTSWKRSIEPWWHYIPVYVGMGNHEVVNYIFGKDNEAKVVVDMFPYSKVTGFRSDWSESVFADGFVNFENGPESEDGSPLDPNKNKMDFPSYKENVYYFTYDNVAVIMLNSDYTYSPSLSDDFSATENNGGLHGYIMDNQLAWLKKTLKTLEENKNIDHIFVTQHTPALPNSAHVSDDMWYDGNNSPRPRVANKEAEVGIIQRRDEYFKALMTDSSKVKFMLTGDEHNAYWLCVTKDLDLYPDNWKYEKITDAEWFKSGQIYIVNNGSAGAPYYAQVQTPWSKAVNNFTMQYAVVLFNVDGENIEVDIDDPVTLDRIVSFSYPANKKNN